MAMKVLFIHGLASSGAYKTADHLRSMLEPCEVLSPDVPTDPDEAFRMLSELCLSERPDLVVGLSLGGFWAQQLRGFRKILVNPGFHTSELLRTMIGEVAYLSPRADGARSFTVTEELCDRYEEIERTQFDGISEEDIALTDGIFALEDERVRFGSEFEAHYPGKAHFYHGRHLPSFPELKAQLLPLVRK